MHPDERYAGWAEEVAHVRRRVFEHVKERLSLLAADPDGELARTAQMLGLKRGSRR